MGLNVHGRPPPTMSVSSHAPAGSATIAFRKIIDVGALTHDALNDILAYPVDVAWVDGYLSKKRWGWGGMAGFSPLRPHPVPPVHSRSSDSSVWSSAGPHGASFAQRLLDALM